MPLDRQTVIDDIRASNPEYFETWDDSKIFNYLQYFTPEIKFEAELPGAASYRQYGAVEVPDFMERAKHQLETQWDDMNVGLYGIMPWNQTEATENLRAYNKNLYKQKIADNTELQALTAWKEDEPGWTNLHTTMRSLSEAIPSLALAMTGTIVGLGLAKITGGSSLAYSFASLAPMFGMESGAQYNEAMATLVDELGMDPEEARGYAQMTAVAYGSIASILERIGAQHYLKLVGIGRKTATGDLRRTLAQKLVSTGLNKGKLVRGGVRMMAGAAKSIEGTLIEGSTEWMQAYTQNTINEAMRLGFGKDKMSASAALTEAFKKTWNNPAVWEEGFAGATTGVLLFPFGAATSTQASKITLKDVTELQEKEEDDTRIAEEPDKFGAYLSALFDPDLMTEVVSNVTEGDVIGQRIQVAQDSIGSVGKKILWVLGKNPDILDQLYNHPNAKILLAEVRQVFIDEGGLDENSGDKELESIIAHHIRSGKWAWGEGDQAQDSLISEIEGDPTLVLSSIAEDIGEGPMPSKAEGQPAQPTFAELEKRITKERREELLDEMEASVQAGGGTQTEFKASKLNKDERAWLNFIKSPDFESAMKKDTKPGDPWFLPTSWTVGVEAKKVIAEFDKGVEAENLQQQAESQIITDPKGNYQKGQIVQLNIDPNKIKNKNNQAALKNLDPNKKYAVMGQGKKLIFLKELDADGNIVEGKGLGQKDGKSIEIYKGLFMGKENPQKTDHLKIIGKGEKIYETQYDKQYEKQYEETDRIKVGGKIIETKGQSDVDQMTPSQLLAKAKELGIKDQLPKTKSGAVSKSEANIVKIRELIKSAMPQPVAKPVTDTQAIIKEIQQEKEAKTAEETLETDEEAVPAPWTGVKKIISGGQIRADQIGLEVGQELGIETGGTAPPGFQTSEGPQKEKLEGFGLVEGEADPKIYPKRTEKNVVDADGTVLFGDETSRGSALTKRMAEKHGKAFIANPTSDELSAWLSDNNIETLNIAGNRTLSKGVKGMKDVLRKALGKPSEETPLTPTEESFIKVYEDNEKRLEFSGALEEENPKEASRLAKEFGYKEPTAAKQLKYEKLKEQQGLLAKPLKTTKAKPQISKEQAKEIKGLITSESGMEKDEITSNDVYKAAEAAGMDIDSDEFYAFSKQIVDKELTIDMSNDEKGQLIDAIEDKVRFEEFEEAGEKPVKATKDNIKDFDDHYLTKDMAGEEELQYLESGDVTPEERLVFIGDKPHIQDQDGVTEEISVAKAVELVNASLEAAKPEAQFWTVAPRRGRKKGITSKDVHEAAKKAGMNINSEAFHDLSEGLTGEEHIDKMDNDDKRRMIDYLEKKAKPEPILKVDKGTGTPAPAKSKKEEPKNPATKKKGLSAKDKKSFIDKRIAGEPLASTDLSAAEMEYYGSPEFDRDFLEAQADVDKDIEVQRFTLPEDDIDFQNKNSSTEQLISENKKIADRILARLTKHFPNVDVKTFEGVLEVFGVKKIGYAVEGLVAWSTTDGRLDTMPHEYAHIYVKLLRNENIIKLGLKKFGTAEEEAPAILTNEQRRIMLLESASEIQELEEEGLSYKPPGNKQEFRLGDVRILDAEKKGKGLGTRFVDAKKKEFLAKGKDHMEIIAEPGSESFWKKQGFSEYGKSTDYIEYKGKMVLPSLMRADLSLLDRPTKFSEEELVKQIGLYYTKRIQTASMRNNIRVWLKQFVARLKKMFGVLPKNKEAVLRFIAEEFYQGRYLGIDVTVGDQWIEYEDKASAQELDETGESEDESNAPEVKQSSIPTGIRLSHFMHDVLGVYINNKFHYPIMMDLADKYDKYQDYEDALFEWAGKMAAERNFPGDELIKSQEEVNRPENVSDKNRMKNEWSRIQSRIQRFSLTNKKAQGRNTRMYLEVIMNYDEADGSNQTRGMRPAGEYDKANERAFSQYVVRSFIEDDFKNDVHDSRTIILPLKQILTRLKTKESAKGLDDGRVFYKSSAPDMSVGFINSLQYKAGEEYIRKLQEQVFNIKTRALKRAEDGLSEKANIKIILEDIEKMDKRGTLLSIIGSKLGDNSAIISTAVRQMPHQMTPELFNAIIEEEIRLGNINKETHATILRSDGNYDKFKNSKNDLVNAASFSEYALKKITIDLAKSDTPINDFFDIFGKDMNSNSGLKGTVAMSQAIAQLRWWQNMRTPDYFMYEKSAGDSMIRLSINMAEGPSPLEAGDMKLMVIDPDVKIGGLVWERDDNGDWVYDNQGKHKLVEEEINFGSMTYGDYDGASMTGTQYLSKTGDSLGYNVLQQLKTFIRQRDIDPTTGEVSYIGMKHMQFAAYKGMKFFKDGKLIVEVREDSNRRTYFYDLRTQKKFDMISSSNEAKMTFGKYASTQQKIDAFGEGKYEDGYYKIHTIKPTSIKVTQVLDKSKWSASYPIAMGEMMLSLGVDSNEVNALLKGMRGRYVDIVNHYTEQITNYYENPALLADFIRKAARDGEVPDELQRYIALIPEEGEFAGYGMFHPAIITHILPVLNSKLIKDGINKARGYKGEGTVLYIKPPRNNSISKHHHLKKDHVIMSADNSPSFRKISKLFRDKNPGIDWQNSTRHERINMMNKYLEDYEVYILIHHNPIAKVTGPVARRVQSLEEGLGETTVMSTEDVKNILDADQDGDKNAMEFVSKAEIDAMLAWQNSDMFAQVDNIVSLKPFGKRVDDPTNEDTSTVLSRNDVHSEIHRNSKNDGSTGVMMNGRTIMAQLHSKELVITVGKGEDAYQLTPADPLSEVVMDYIKLEPSQLTNDELKIISDNGDSIVVHKDGKPTKKTVKINKIDDTYSITGQPSDKETWHLSTTKGHEMSILFQMAVDGSKFPFLGQIIAEQSVSNFQFMISRIFQKDGTDNLNKTDITFLSKVYAAQNLSRQRAGRTRTGISTDYQVNLDMSEDLHKRHNSKPVTDKQLLGNENGVAMGTKSNKKYAEAFVAAIAHEISMSDWQAKYNMSGYTGHNLSTVNISMKNLITPMESLLMSLASKIKSHELHQLLTDTPARKMAHVLAMQELWKSPAVQGIMDAANRNKNGEFTDAHDFIYKDKVTWIPGLADNLQERIQNLTKNVEGKLGTSNFANIWDDLMELTGDQEAIQADTSQSFVDFTDLFIEKFLSLTPEAQAWTTLEFLGGTRNADVYVQKLLPLDLMHDSIIEKYLPIYEKHLRNIVGKTDVIGAREIRKSKGQLLPYQVGLAESTKNLGEEQEEQNEKVCTDA